MSWTEFLRRNGEVAGLGADAVSEVAALVFGVRVDRQFHRIQLEAGVVGRGLVADVVEYEELGFGSEEHAIADTHRLDHRLGLLGDAARVAVVGLACGWLQHVAGDDHSGLGEERIDRGGDRVEHQAHIGLVDRLPAGDRGAVEHDALGKRVLFDHADVESHMLPLAARIGEAQVDVFDVVVLDRFQDVFGGLHEYPFWLQVVAIWPRAETVGQAQYNRGKLNTISDYRQVPSQMRLVRKSCSDGVQPGFAGPDANGFLDVGDEDLPVADASGLGRAPDRIDRPLDQVVPDHDLDFNFG